MPCGAVFENITGVSQRKEIKLTDDEIQIIKDHRRDLELKFKLISAKKESKIHSNQTKVATEIFDCFNNESNGNSVINVMAVSPTQSGKTGIIFETIRLFIKETNISYQNIYVITGLSSVEWKKQTKDRLPDMLKSRVFHRCDLSSTFYKDIERKKNVLIILDEIQIASAKDQTIHKVFDELNFMNLETLLKKNVKFLEITATPNGSIYDLSKWGENFSKKIIVQPPEQYTSCFKLLDEGRVKQFRDLCDDIIVDKKIVSAVENVQELKETIDEYFSDDFRFHFIRTKVAEGQDKTRNNFKHVFGENVKIIDFDMENKESDINNIVKEKPDEHTFIFIKEKLRCAKTIENKNLVGVYYERYTGSVPDDDVIIQGMLGRATGYNDNGDSIIYTNITSINKYRKLLESNFDDRTVNWMSSSTIMRKNIIRGVNFYNTPDNIKGFKVIEYDNDTETCEEKKERIARQKLEREERKQAKELEKEDKQKIKEVKEKEKEELKEKKKLEREAKQKEREAKQKEREAMKKAKEALKEQQKKEREELKENKKKEKEPKEKKEKKEKKIEKKNDKESEPLSKSKSDSEDSNDFSKIYRRNFRVTLRNELKSYANEYKEINNKEIDSEVLTNYLKEVCTKTFASKFDEVCEEQGDPKTWENDVYREFISGLSDLYKKYPLEKEEEEKEEEVKPQPKKKIIEEEDIPEVQPKKKYLKNLKRVLDDDE
jgi:hypothetical protein